MKVGAEALEVSSSEVLETEEERDGGFPEDSFKPLSKG